MTQFRDPVPWQFRDPVWFLFLILVLSSYSGETKDVYFSVGLQGIHDDDIPKVKDIVAKTIDQVIE